MSDIVDYHQNVFKGFRFTKIVKKIKFEEFRGKPKQEIVSRDNH